MRDTPSATMGLGALGPGKRMFQPFIVTDYAVKDLDAWEEVQCPRNTSEESHRQQPPASMIYVVSLSWFILSVPPNGSLPKTGRLQMSNHVYRIGNVSPFAIWPSVGHRARVRTHAWRVVDSTSLGHTKQACLSVPLSLANTYFHLYQYHMLYDFIQFPPCLKSHFFFNCLLVNCLLVSCQIHDWLLLESILNSIYNCNSLFPIVTYSCE